MASIHVRILEVFPSHHPAPSSRPSPPSGGEGARLVLHSLGEGGRAVEGGHGSNACAKSERRLPLNCAVVAQPSWLPVLRVSLPAEHLGGRDAAQTGRLE